jgi:glycosyltransferase involved in cell wall biosynthesis
VKIGILLWELDINGGTQRQALSLARELQARKDEITVYCVRFDKERCYGNLMDDLAVCSFESKGFQRGVERLLPKILRRWIGKDAHTDICRNIGKYIPEDLDLLNVHDYAIYPAAYFWKLRTGKPVIWMMNDLPGAMAASDESFFGNMGRFLTGKTMERTRHRCYAKGMDEIVVLDSRNRDLVARTIGRDSRIIRSGLDLKAFSWIPRKPPDKARPIRLLSNSIFSPHRRLEDIVDALTILRDRNLPFLWIHVGPDSRDKKYAEWIYSQVERNALASNVVFTGEVDDGALSSYYQEADAFLYPNAPQTWGLAVFQAMACGTPAIVSRGAGAAEVLTHRRNALLVDSRSPAQIADAVEELVRDGSLWGVLHEEGRKFVEMNISWDLYAGEMRKIFMAYSHAG